jgi:uncharacterized iron-regulated membrane protein
MSPNIADPCSEMPCENYSRPRSWLAAVYPAVWRWHFWAGLLIAPFLIVVATTGALYVFQEELSVLTAPSVLRVPVPFKGQPLAYSERVAAARVTVPAEWEFSGFEQSPEPDRADQITFERQIDPASEHAHEHRLVFVDPYTAQVLGQYDYEGSFFGIVLKLHRTLLAGTTGRVLVEIATCWGVVSLVTGLLLWWPRGKEKLWGVWLPRLRKGGKFALRDLHTIPGLYLCAAVFAIMFTGLLYTKVWGPGAFAGLYFGGQLPAAYVSPPKSTVLAAGAKPVAIDEVVAEARKHYPFPEFNLQAPHKPGETWTVYGPTQDGNLKDGVVYIDVATGRTITTIDYASLKGGAKTALLFYSIHTGSIFGTPTKILAVLACLVIIAMSVTGVWMWWRRRPAGTFGALRRTNGELVPRTAIIAIVALALFFPLVGLSLVVLWLAELVLRRLRHTRPPVR